MFYGGMANVPGAPGNPAFFNQGSVTDLVYRGEPVSGVPLPYYGGSMGYETLAQGIPVGQDSRFPMSQESFEQEVDRRRLEKMFGPVEQGGLLRYIRESQGRGFI